MSTYDELGRLQEAAFDAKDEAARRCTTVLMAAVDLLVANLGVPDGAWTIERGDEGPLTWSPEGTWEVVLSIRVEPRSLNNPGIAMRLRARPSETGADIAFGDWGFDFKGRIECKGADGSERVVGLDGLPEFAGEKAVTFFKGSRAYYEGKSGEGKPMGFGNAI